MDLIAVLSLAVTFPVACLGFLLWMARLEDRLPDAARRAAKRPDPPPVLAIPVQRRPPVQERIFTDQPTDPADALGQPVPDRESRRVVSASSRYGATQR